MTTTVLASQSRDSDAFQLYIKTFSTCHQPKVSTSAALLVDYNTCLNSDKGQR